MLPMFPPDTGHSCNMAQAFATRLAYIGFAAATLMGCLANADFASCVQRALVAGGLLYVAGLLLGEIVRHVIEEQIAREFAAGELSAAEQTAR